MASIDCSTGWTEGDRLRTLMSYDVLDTAPERDFDDVAGLAAKLCDAPMAMVSLVDENRQWFKARVGLEAFQTGRDVSFCDHAMRENAVMVVRDARHDPRFADNALVNGPPGIRFYAGAPLVTPSGLPLGSLCVLDTEPRPDGLMPVQAEALTVLAKQVMSLLELRRAVKDRITRGQELASAVDALSESEARLRAMADSMPQMVWATQPDGFHDYYNARWYEYTGVPAGSTDGEGWNGMFHPDDQARAWEAWRHSLETGDLYEIEYRLRHASGAYRWVLGRATPIRDAEGRITRWFGTCTDIDDLKRLQQGKDLLSQELSHRIKNIFAVITALISLSAREHPEARTFAGAFKNRIGALARAHEFVRPHTESSRPTVGSMTLHAFLEALFRPYAGEEGQPRVLLSGDDAVFDDQSATSVALLFHELATNAAKYGALSHEDGRVHLDTQASDERFVLTWTERGGPTVAGVPERSGFGSSLATVSVEGQLNGRLERRWLTDGLVVIADLPAAALSRRRAALKSF